MRERRPNIERGADSPPADPSIDVYGRDEMNLAEFPIAALTDYVPRGCNTIYFSDGSGSLMVTGSDAYGLPTAADADVVVALIQLTKRRNGFQAPAVHFNPTEVLEILGWPESGKSYRRLTESLMRWSTTSLKYEGTWWDQRARRKINAVFHILNEVVLFDRSGPVDGESGQPPQSYFAWNKVFLSSCQAGNLKRLDLGMYFALEHASSKRLYRFLDKRLHRQPDQTFDLAEVAFERVGLSRGYVGKKGAINVAKVREKLRPAIAELESGGFLVPMSPEDRYQKHEDGWVIRFVGTGEAKPDADEAEPGSIPLVGDGSALLSAGVAEAMAAAVEGLVGRGVVRSRAEDLASRHPSARISEKLEIFDWKQAKDSAGMKRNPAGWLVKAIEDDYPAPRGFASRADREALFDRGRVAAEQSRRAQLEARSRDQAFQAIDESIAQLSPNERAALEAEAIAGATQQAIQALQAPGLPRSIRKALLLAMIRDHVATKLNGRTEARPIDPSTTID